MVDYNWINILKSNLGAVQVINVDWIIFSVLAVAVLIGLAKLITPDVHFGIYQLLWWLIITGIYVLLIAVTFSYRQATRDFAMDLMTVVTNYTVGYVLILIGFILTQTRLKAGRIAITGGTLLTLLLAYLMFYH